LAKLAEWLQDPVHKMIFISKFKYVPTEANMATIVITAALGQGQRRDATRTALAQQDEAMRSRATWFKRRRKDSRRFSIES